MKFTSTFKKYIDECIQKTFAMKITSILKLLSSIPLTVCVVHQGIRLVDKLNREKDEGILDAQSKILWNCIVPYAVISGVFGLSQVYGHHYRDLFVFPRKNRWRTLAWNVASFLSVEIAIGVYLCGLLNAYWNCAIDKNIYQIASDSITALVLLIASIQNSCNHLMYMHSKFHKKRFTFIDWLPLNSRICGYIFWTSFSFSLIPFVTKSVLRLMCSMAILFMLYDPRKYAEQKPDNPNFKEETFCFSLLVQVMMLFTSLNNFIDTFFTICVVIIIVLIFVRYEALRHIKEKQVKSENSINERSSESDTSIVSNSNDQFKSPGNDRELSSTPNKLLVERQKSEDKLVKLMGVPLTQTFFVVTLSMLYGTEETNGDARTNQQSPDAVDRVAIAWAFISFYGFFIADCPHEKLKTLRKSTIFRAALFLVFELSNVGFLYAYGTKLLSINIENNVWRTLCDSIALVILAIISIQIHLNHLMSSNFVLNKKFHNFRNWCTNGLSYLFWASLFLSFCPHFWDIVPLIMFTSFMGSLYYNMLNRIESNGINLHFSSVCVYAIVPLWAGVLLIAHLADLLMAGYLFVYIASIYVRPMILKNILNRDNEVVQKNNFDHAKKNAL